MTGKSSDELHAEMWRHYDNLRQEKNKTFLTANIVFVAVFGVVWKVEPVIPFSIAISLSLLGIFVCVFWFFVLGRNSAYIEFHRDHVSLWQEEWVVFKQKLPLWQKLSSTLVDRFLAMSFGVFYLIMFGYFILKVLRN